MKKRDYLRAAAVQRLTVIVSLALLCLLLSPAVSQAQTNVGSIAGTVTDSTGGVIVGATVTALNSATNEKRTTQSNNLGEYVLYSLPPATYDLIVGYSSFKTVKREQVILQVAEKLRVDFRLEPGAVTETIEVRGASPLLQPETSSLGTVFTSQTISALPLNGRNAYELVALSPGVNTESGWGTGGVPSGGLAQGTQLNRMSINGGRNLTNSFMLDDVDNVLMGLGAVSVIPTLDTVQEFNVLTNSLSAKYGRSGGGLVTTVTKSGTNTLHGNFWEFLRNDKLDANNFFANSAGRERPPLRQNEFGGTVGGHIRRDKTFFFSSYEAFRRVLPGQTLLTVPTDREKKGDFSQTFTYDSNGNPTLAKVFNPFTTTRDPDGNFVRQQFSGNVIPDYLFDPVAKNLLQYFPEPNLPGDPVTHANNFVSQVGFRELTDSVMGRIDHNISERQRLFGRYSFTRHHSGRGNVLGNIADPYSTPNLDRNQGLTLSYTNTLSPTMVLNLRYGFVRGTLFQMPASYGFDPVKLGFPASLVQQFQVKMFPSIQIQGYTPIGFNPWSMTRQASTTNSVAANLSKIVGRHSIEAGLDLRLLQGGMYQPGWPSGSYAFDAGFTNGMQANSPDPTAGNGFASFLLGTFANCCNNAAIAPSWFLTTRYYSFYVQDDIKVSSKLTLNVGLRYDYESPLHDRRGQLNWIDFEHEIPLTVSQVDVPGVGPLPKLPFVGGGAMYPDVNGSGPVMLPQRLNFQPRVGLAYSISPKTVIRTAYGIMYPGTGSDNGNNFPNGAVGFSAMTSVQLAPDGYTPMQRADRGFMLSNPYPNGLTPVTGSSLGLLTNLGNWQMGFQHDAHHAYIQQWNFGIQRQLPGDLLIEVAYVGSHGVRVPDFLGYNANQMPDQYLALGNSLFDSYPNPFFGVLPASSGIGGSPTITLQQLLTPYPEFVWVQAVPNYETSSTYNGFQLKAQKRMSYGLSMLASYTIAKALDTTSGTTGNQVGVWMYQDSNNRSLDHSLNSVDRSQIFGLSPIYDLPFGRGKALAGNLSNRFVNRLISGWTVAGILNFATGYPIGITCASGCSFPATRPNLNGNPALSGGGSNESRLTHWFNTTAFGPNVPFTFGTAPRNLSNVRGPGTANSDVSVIKNTQIGDRYSVQFRADLFNALNRPQFGLPDSSFGSSTFGQISQQVNNPRQIQLGLKFYY